MKRFFKTVLCIAAVLTAVASCQKEVPEEFSFDVQNVQGTQSFVFGQMREFPFTSVNVSKTSFEKPAGWDARLNFSSKMLEITAPSGDGDAKGAVAVTVTSPGGQTKTVKVDVEATEAAMKFSVDGIADGISLKYGEGAEFKAVMENVASVEASGVKGWKAEKVSDTAIKVTAPSKSDASAELEGTLVLTPKSSRGTVGSPVSAKVSVKMAEPSVQLDKSELNRINLGDVNVIKTTELTNVAKLEVKSAPKGWKVDVKLASSAADITVTAPAKGSDFEGVGEIVLLATSETDSTCEVKINVSLMGINNAEDFLKCAEEFAKKGEGDITPYLLDGELVMNCDIDLSGQKINHALFKGQDFKMTFNGMNHTLKYALEADGGLLGLFDTVGPGGVVKNLTVDGSITYGGDNKCGGVTCWSDGATYENITVKIAYTQTGGYAGGAGNFGGISAAETSPSGGGHYKNCHFLGTIVAQSTRYLGGIIGDLWDNSPDTVMENCSNQGSISINSAGTRIQDITHGGLIGNCRGANPTLKNCYNTANMTYDFGGARGDAEGIGGIAGYAAGTYEGCYNTGNITFVDNNCVRGWAHVGGFVGQARRGKTWDGFNLKNCYSKCTVKAYGEDVSVFVGLLQEFNPGMVMVENCYAEGTADCVYGVTTDNIGGFIGNINDIATVKNCRFTGTVRGYVFDTAGGFMGQSGYGNATNNDVVLENCKMEGNVYIGSHTSETSTTRPLVGGLAVSWGPKLTITGSSMKGNIFTMCPAANCVEKVFVSRRVVDGKPDEESSTADDATVAGCKDVKITNIARTDTFPADWK